MKVAYSIKFQIPNSKHQIPKFKPSVFLRGLFVGICFLLFGISASAAGGKFTKTIKETFGVEANTSIEASNKHGDIQIHTWDKNEVTFEIIVTVEAKTEADAEDELERIDVEFTNIPGVVRAETNWEEKEKKGWWIFDWSSWGNWNGWEDGNKVRVDYSIYMPAENVVNLNNKYGNINFPTFDNDAKFTVKYGNMTGERVGGSLNLDIGYGDADIQSVGGESQVDIKYGKFRADVLQSINIESKYSKIYLDNSHDIRDDFEIEKVNNIEIDSKYSDYKIYEMTGEGDFDMEYGDAKIKNMAADFGNLQIEGSYANFTFYMPSGAAYEVDVESSYGDLDFRNDGHLDIHKDNADRKVKGYVGSSIPNHKNENFGIWNLTCYFIIFKKVPTNHFWSDLTKPSKVESAFWANRRISCTTRTNSSASGLFSSTLLTSFSTLMTGSSSFFLRWIMILRMTSHISFSATKNSLRSPGFNSLNTKPQSIKARIFIFALPLDIFKASIIC